MPFLHIIWLLAILYLIFFDLYFLLRLAFHKPVLKKFTEAVSVVVCARNEEHSIERCIMGILKQQYPNFELIVIDDASTDQTWSILENLAADHSKLLIHRIDVDDPLSKTPGKRAALRRGIQLAKNDIILLTDADCWPISPTWISSMVDHFKDKEVVLGYSPYKTSGTFVGFLAQWENFETAMQYLAFSIAGRPYMGVGRNLAYRKSVYLNHIEIEEAPKIASGDDDLLIASIAMPANTAIEYGAEAQTLSQAPSNLKAWWNQKRRHLSTSWHYALSTKILLGAFGGSKLLFYLLLPLWIPESIPSWIKAFVVIRIALHYFVVIANAGKLRQWNIILLWPLWEFCATVLLSGIHLLNLINPRTKSWS